MLFQSSIRKELARSFWCHAGGAGHHRHDHRADPHPGPGFARHRQPAGRDAGHGLLRPRAPADHPDPLAVHCHGQHPVAHVPRQRNGDLVHQRPGAGRLFAPAVSLCLAGAAGHYPDGAVCLALDQPADQGHAKTATSSAATWTASRPAQFQESSSGNRVFFIDRDLAGEKASNNVFIAATEKGKSSITTAQSGRIESRDDAQFLMLSNGQRLENEMGKSALKISDFEEYGVKTDDSGLLGALRARSQAAVHPRTDQRPHAQQPGRAGLAARPGPVGHQLRGAGAGAGQRQPARRAQRQPDFCRCWPSWSTTTWSIWARAGFLSA